jgi:cytochrome c-type biogenesis protein CcmE
MTRTFFRGATALRFTQPRLRRRLRLYGLLLFLLGFATATGLTLFALRGNLSYFRTPSAVATGHYPEYGSGRAIRLGGMVEKGSLKREGETVTFRITDYAHNVPVRYRGLVPDLFREGQGVVVEGKMGPGGVFVAQQLLAKHDEKYMPPEVAAALKQAAASKALTPKSP